MSKLLLLVQSEADVQHLDAAAKAILNSSITGVWIVFSPAITVNTSEAAKKLDGEIEALKVAETQAATRTDYEAAQGYKAQREGKELDRQKVLRDAWKTAPEEARKAKTQEIFKPFAGQLQPKGLAVRITGHSDHYDREQWVAMLNSLSGVWFKEFVPGSFVVGWPESVETSIKSAKAEMVSRLEAAERLLEVATPKSPIVQTNNDGVAVSAPAPVVKPPSPRQKQLENMHGLKRRNIAKTLGIDVTGKEPDEVIGLILAAEAGKKAAAEPELAEY